MKMAFNNGIVLLVTFCEDDVSRYFDNALYVNVSSNSYTMSYVWENPVVNSFWVEVTFH